MENQRLGILMRTRTFPIFITVSVHAAHAPCIISIDTQQQRLAPLPPPYIVPSIGEIAHDLAEDDEDDTPHCDAAQHDEEHRPGRNPALWSTRDGEGAVGAAPACGTEGRREGRCQAQLWCRHAHSVWVGGLADGASLHARSVSS